MEPKWMVVLVLEEEDWQRCKVVKYEEFFRSNYISLGVFSVRAVARAYKTLVNNDIDVNVGNGTFENICRKHKFNIIEIEKELKYRAEVTLPVNSHTPIYEGELVAVQSDGMAIPASCELASKQPLYKRVWNFFAERLRI